MTSRARHRCCALLCALCSLPVVPFPSAGALPMEWHVSNGAYPEFPPGFVIRAEQRFDPLVQRLMAEHELRALPLRDGQLFYVVPAGMDPHQQEVQIRYIEWLLRQQVIEPDSASP